jgi:NADPH oxidase 2
MEHEKLEEETFDDDDNDRDDENNIDINNNKKNDIESASTQQQQQRKAAKVDQRWWVRFGRGYSRRCDYIGVKLFSHPFLTWPLLGPLTKYIVDINIVELILCGAIAALVMIGGSGSHYGVASAIASVFPLVLICRNNILTILLGVPHDRLVKYHGWASYFAMLPITLHGIDYGNYFEPMTELSGTIAWISLGVLIVTSLPLVRRYVWNLFMVLHLVFIGFVIMCIIHTGTSAAAMGAGLGLYAIDVVIRLFRSIPRARGDFQVLEGDMTKMTLKSSALPRYKPGQYAYVSIPRLSRVQWHPFSVSSGPAESDVTFHIRDLGNWSHDVVLLGNASEVSVRVDGPYGHPAVPYKRYRSVVLVSGGAGITPLISTLKDIAHRRATGARCRVERCHFVWVVPNNATASWFAAELRDIAASAPPADVLKLTVSVFVTREAPDAAALGNGINARQGRPEWNELFGALADQHKDFCQKVALMTCGPNHMVHCIRFAAMRSSNAIGGVSFHTHLESFEF